MSIRYHIKRSAIHGRGLFAARKYKKGDLIGIYDGQVTTREGNYVLHTWDPEGNAVKIAGKGPLRFVNHSSRPNADFFGDELYAVKRIQAGDEITFNYGPDWKDDP
jgi:SET domain-containing protein